MANLPNTRTINKPLLCVAMLVTLSLPVFSQVPDSLSFQGCLTDDTGNPVSDGDHNVSFMLYDHPTVGDVVWKENQILSTDDCIYDTYLGQNNTLSEIAFDKRLWLAIDVEDTGELTPRTALASAAYAFGLRDLRVIPVENLAWKTVNLIGGKDNQTSAGVMGASIGGGGGLDKLAAEETPNVVSGNFGTIGGGRGN